MIILPILAADRQAFREQDFWWTAIYLHALNNQPMAFFMAAVMMPISMAMSFGIGLPALVLCALVILLILRDPIWKQILLTTEGGADRKRSLKKFYSIFLPNQVLEIAYRTDQILKNGSDI